MSLRKDKGESLIRFFDDYVVVDIETTGLDFSCHIIEISALKVSGNSIVDKFSSLVKPAPFFIPEDDFKVEHYVNSFITDLTGITDDMLRNAPPLKQVISDFATFIGDSVLIGHNIASFDSNFLYDAFIKILNIPLSNDFVDTLRIARWTLPNLQHHRLSDLAEYYHIDHQTMHCGIVDCQITQSCYEKLKSDLIRQYGTLDAFYSYVDSRLNKTDYSLYGRDSINKANFDISIPAYDPNSRSGRIKAPSASPRKKGKGKDISEVPALPYFLLTLFLGPIGAHRFYRGQIGLGIFYLLTAGVFAIGWVIDLVYATSNLIRSKTK